MKVGEPGNREERGSCMENSEEEEICIVNRQCYELDNDDETELQMDIDQELRYPDPEFYDFDIERFDDCLDVGQIWSAYDDIDAMPRLYCHVKKVLSTESKLLINWLDAFPVTTDEQHWYDQELPVSCGTFEIGEDELVMDQLVLSNRMDCRMGKRRNTYVIYPKKGQTWAIFMDWDMKWCSEPEKHTPPYRFEVVEIMSDFSEGFGVRVAVLSKVEGFVSIFQRIHYDVDTSFCIRPTEISKFSHHIPSRRMIGMEREGVPIGAFELDTAALPCSVFNNEHVAGDEAKEVHSSKEAATSYPASAKYKVEPTRTFQEACASDPERCSLVSEIPTTLPNSAHKKNNQASVGRFGDQLAKRGCEATVFSIILKPSSAPKFSSEKNDNKIPSSCENHVRTSDSLSHSDKQMGLSVKVGSSAARIPPSSERTVTHEESRGSKRQRLEDGVDMSQRCMIAGDEGEISVDSDHVSGQEFDLKQVELATLEDRIQTCKVELERTLVTLQERQEQLLEKESFLHSVEETMKEANITHDGRVAKMKEEVATLEERIKDCKNDLEKIQISIQETRRQRLVEEGFLQSVEDSIKKASLKFEGRKKSVSLCKMELLSKQSELKVLERSIQEFIKKKKALGYARDEVRECCQVLEPKEKELDRIKKSIKATTTVLEVEVKKLNEVKTKLRHHHEKLKAMKEHQNQIQKTISDLKRKRHCYQSGQWPCQELHAVNFVQDQNTKLSLSGKARELQLHLNKHLRNHDLLQNEVSNFLKNSTEPAKLVLEAMNGFYPPIAENKRLDYDVSVTRRSCITLLEHLLSLRPPISADVRGEALKLAVEWKAIMMSKPATSLEALGFLQLVSAFGLDPDFGPDEIKLLLFSCLPQQGNGSEKWRSLGIMGDLAGGKPDQQQLQASST